MEELYKMELRIDWRKLHLLLPPFTRKICDTFLSFGATSYIKNLQHFFYLLVHLLLCPTHLLRRYRSWIRRFSEKFINIACIASPEMEEMKESRVHACSTSPRQRSLAGSRSCCFLSDYVLCDVSDRGEVPSARLHRSPHHSCQQRMFTQGRSTPVRVVFVVQYGSRHFRKTERSLAYTVRTTRARPVRPSAYRGPSAYSGGGKER